MILKTYKKMQTKRKKTLSNLRSIRFWLFSWMNFLGEEISNKGTENNSLMITR